MKMKKTAVITGASGGIGGAAAIQLAKEGYSLALLGHRSKQRCGYLFTLWGFE